jgi:hypothetical protein
MVVEDITIRSRHDGEFVAKLTGHAGKVVGVVGHPFYPDEFVSYSDDQCLIVWRLQHRSDRSQHVKRKASFEAEQVVKYPYRPERAYTPASVQLARAHSPPRAIQSPIAEQRSPLPLSTRAAIEEKIDRILMSPHSSTNEYVPPEYVPIQAPSIQLPFRNSDLVTIHLLNQPLQLYTFDDDTGPLPTAHVYWNSPRSHDTGDFSHLFMIDSVQGTSFLLRAVSLGDYLHLKKDKSLYAKGSITVLTDAIEDATRFTMLSETDAVDGVAMRLTDAKGLHLSCVTIQDAVNGPYHLLGALSILPDPKGIFVLKKMQQ